MKRALIAGVLFLGLAEIGLAQFQYQDTPLLQIIEEVEQQTPFRFLYREALVSNIRLTFSTNSQELFSEFRVALNNKQLDLMIDSTRHQIIIYEQEKTELPGKRISVRGQVVDAATGERLPFATIIWEEKNTTTGVSANQSGAFKISTVLRGQPLEMRCSYVGYATETIVLDLSEGNTIKELTFRLQPKRIDGNELIVTGTNYYGNINRQVSNLVDMGVFSPLGESNTMRALRTLPSVSLSPVMSDGLHVRGSPTDGFHVLIDGVTIYNQSHLFGLIDSFNSDVLQRSGFFYDIAPAQFQAPPGGSLYLYTKTGSLKEFSGSVGMSNSSVRLSLEGPIQKGRSSWLISGRMSYMNAVDWLNNSDLIEWGLNVGRNKEVLDESLVNYKTQLVRPGEADASFFDLHAKAYFEGKKGSRFVLSGYFGGDHTQQDADRLYRSFSTNGNNLETRSVSTMNDWHNIAGSLQYQRWLGESLFASTTAGVSIYQTSFSKDDFTYITLNNTNGSLQAFVYPYASQSVLNELTAEQQYEYNGNLWFLTGGLSYHYYMGEYFEDSFNRPGYFNAQNAHQADFYAQLDYIGIDWLDIFSGVRLHYYSNGNYLRWSPRFKLKLFPDADLSLSGGFSRNYQFLNKISLSNTVTSDVWVLVNADHPPTSVNYYSAGIYYSPSDHLFVQAEAYHKQFDNIRLHELNTFALSGTFNNSPWYSDNNGTGKGLEFLFRNQYGFIGLTQTFTISEMKLSNHKVNKGRAFYADWDRTYQYAASLYVKPVSNLTFYFSWLYASGTPNKLAVFGPQQQQRLGHYRRADISAEYLHQFDDWSLNISLSVFNVLDRQNPWYRELAFVIDQSTSPNKFRSVAVDVYDLGFQPSFNISINF